MGIDTHNFHPARHWFVPLDELDAVEGALLRPANLKPSANERLADEGDSFVVTLESLLIVKKYDRKSDNDLLVRSRLKYGNDPIVESINLFENDVPAGTVRDNLLCEYIYSQDKYSKLDRVHLEVEVMELPGSISLDRDISKGLNLIKSTFGIVLSSLLPFGGVAFDVMKKVNTIRNRRRQIFLSQLDLYGEGGEGEARLRYGAYVFFRKPVDATDYKLQNLQLKHKAPEDAPKPLPHDYVVVKVVPVAIRVGSSEEVALNNQRLATTLGTTDGKMDVNAEWHPNFDRFMPEPEILKKLAIFYGLRKRKNAREILDTAQQKLYEMLLQELRDFL
ncbi:MAG: hypothetical protein F6K11_10845 [Leptolyngbya sp. SIO3F4]|nr:hypothetical protein [Leptolyngbya sp. SIO3F4]